MLLGHQGNGTFPGLIHTYIRIYLHTTNPVDFNHWSPILTMHLIHTHCTYLEGNLGSYLYLWDFTTNTIICAFLLPNTDLHYPHFSSLNTKTMYSPFCKCVLVLHLLLILSIVMPKSVFHCEHYQIF